MQTEFVIETRGPGLYEITGRLCDWLETRGEGVVTLFIRHSSASLLIQENADPDEQADPDYFARLLHPADAPQMRWLRPTAEGPTTCPLTSRLRCCR